MVEKKTPLYDVHVALGAKVIEFGGWMMPVQYTGIIEEHRAVRQAAGLFDVSHMGEVYIVGPEAETFINRLITNDVTKVAVNQVMYSPMCYENGGVVDDLLVYRLGETEYLLVINAGNIDKDYEWILKYAEGYNVKVENRSDVTAEVAIQGPQAEAILQKLTEADLASLKYYWLLQNVKISGINCLVSRTGYTGEDGFEIYCSAGEIKDLWQALMNAGQSYDLQPAGLGARDTLRFEAALPLYGHELSAAITPLEAGLDFAVKLTKEGFNGYAALKEQKETGLSRRIVGVEMVGRGIARAGYSCFAGEKVIGTITSGSFAPTLGKNLALALLEIDYITPGTPIEVEIRGKRLEAITVTKPFYKRRK